MLYFFSGNIAETKTRTVTIVDTLFPLITITGPMTVFAEGGLPYIDEGATALDLLDGDISEKINSFSTSASAGNDFFVTYTVADRVGHFVTIHIRLLILVVRHRIYCLVMQHIKNNYNYQ